MGSQSTRWYAAVTVLALLLACEVPVAPRTVAVASVAVTPGSASLVAGRTLQLSATLKDSAGNPLSGRTVTWTTDGAAVATVNGTGLVRGIAAGSATITATSEGKSGTATITVTTPPPPPPPTAASCLLTQAGPTTTLSGLQASAFDQEALAAGTRLDARTAQFLLPTTTNAVTHVAGGVGICWSGGEVLGGFAPNTSWDTMHNAYGMIGGVTLSANAPSYIVENFTAFDYGKGISMDAGGDTSWIIRNLHVTYGRDDCIENDWYNTGVVDSSFLDGCYDVMSSLQDPGLPVPDGSANTVTIQNSLMRLQVMDAIYETPRYLKHEAFWKWSATYGPKLNLYNNVFFTDDSAIAGNGASMYMAPPPGKLGNCSNNIMVWEGNGPFPEPLPSCFTVVTGASGLQLWDSVVTLWKAHHPYVLPDIAPPIVSLFQPGIQGSDTLSGTVTLIATAVDDRGVAGVQFKLDGQNIGVEQTAPTLVGRDLFTKFQLTWDSRSAANGLHSLSATARDAAGNTTTAVAISVTVKN